MSNRRKARPGRVSVGARATLRPGVPLALGEQLVAAGLVPCPDCTGEGGVLRSSTGGFELYAEHDPTCPYVRPLLLTDDDSEAGA